MGILPFNYSTWILRGAKLTDLSVEVIKHNDCAKAKHMKLNNSEWRDQGKHFGIVFRDGLGKNSEIRFNKDTGKSQFGTCRVYLKNESTTV